MMGDIDSIRIQVRSVETKQIVFDGQVTYSPEPVELWGVFTPDAEYQARYIYTAFGDRETTWSGWCDPFVNNEERIVLNHG